MTTRQTITHDLMTDHYYYGLYASGDSNKPFIFYMLIDFILYVKFSKVFFFVIYEN